MICAELSTVAWFVPKYWQLRDLCRTIDICLNRAELLTVTWFMPNFRTNQPSSYSFLTTQHNIHLLVGALLMFLELQTSMSQSHIQACEWVSMFQQKHYYSCIHRARSSVFLGKRNVRYRCLTFCHALYSPLKHSHLLRRYRSGSSVVFAWKTEENWVENIQKIKTSINKIYKFTFWRLYYIQYNTIQYNTIQSTRRTQQLHVLAFVKPSSGCNLKWPQYTVGSGLNYETSFTFMD